uniref:Uncharacterized protein n=1 Tax=Oryza brachyantha TaxID=4533 RepID=J3L9S7_ORYBR
MAYGVFAPVSTLLVAATVSAHSKQADSARMKWFSSWKLRVLMDAFSFYVSSIMYQCYYLVRNFCPEFLASNIVMIV